MTITCDCGIKRNIIEFGHNTICKCGKVYRIDKIDSQKVNPQLTEQQIDEIINELEIETKEEVRIGECYYQINEKKTKDNLKKAGWMKQTKLEEARLMRDKLMCNSDILTLKKTIDLYEEAVENAKNTQRIFNRQSYKTGPVE